jgi:hypothetical protein
MYKILRNCFESFERSSINKLVSINPSISQNPNFESIKPTQIHTLSTEQDIPTFNLRDFESFKYMTLTDAAKQHKRTNKYGNIIGDLKTAYKCFEVYANLGGTGTANRNQIKAKYYKAYYISKGFVESPPNKDKIVAELFKEVADDEVNEFSDAKLRYGYCLSKGKGVELNVSEALKYFEKAAEDDNIVAMYNAGFIYYHGIDSEKNSEKAIHYMKFAAYNNYEPAINFCKEHNIHC